MRKQCQSNAYHPRSLKQPLSKAAPAGSLYKEREKLEEEVRKQEMFKWCKSFKYGFKVRDKSRPGSWYLPEDITVLPPESELEPTIVEKFGQWTQSLRRFSQ